MSGCPVQITSASYTHKVTKLSRLDQESGRESTVFQPEKPTIPRVRIPRKILQIGYSDTPGEKRWKFFKLFFDGKPSPHVAIQPFVHYTRRGFRFCRPFCHDPFDGIVHRACLSPLLSHRTILRDSLSGCRVTGCSIGHPFCRQGALGFAMPTPLDCRQKWCFQSL